MANSFRVSITSKIVHELSSSIAIGNDVYHVQTEDMGRKSCKIITNIFLKGEVISSRKSDYSHLIKLKDADAKISALIEKQHKSAIKGFMDEKTRGETSKSEYFSVVRKLLKDGKGEDALKVIRVGLEHYPSDPFLMTYYGCLLSVVENNPKEGIRICEDSIKHLNAAMPFGSEFFYPVFYLNLGRAYLKAGRKTDSIRAFRKGLKSDPENSDLLKEMNTLGYRKKPPLPFLKRSNPINKYIGLLLHKNKSKQG